VLADCILGDSSKGVFLCKHADIHLKAAARKGQQNCWLFMFLVSFFVQLLLICFNAVYGHIGQFEMETTAKCVVDDVKVVAT